MVSYVIAANRALLSFRSRFFLQGARAQHHSSYEDAFIFNRVHLIREKGKLTTGEREDVDTARSLWKVHCARWYFEARLSPAGI